MAKTEMSNSGSTTTDLLYDEVKSSIELLDKVLSEFEDFDSIDAQLLQQSSVEHDLSNDSNRSLTGHQSEDDGYMSMNGRKAKFVLNIKPVNELNHDNVQFHSQLVEPNENYHKFKTLPPPPPIEQAEQTIAAILPEISTNQKYSKVNGKTDDQNGSVNGFNSPVQSAATQTTLPKTHRSTAWKNTNSHYDQNSSQKSPVYGSLPYANHSIYGAVNSPTKVPPRTVPGNIGKHRVVNRSIFSPEEILKYKIDNENDYSDDSLNEKTYSVASCDKKGIAWEVPLDDKNKSTKHFIKNSPNQLDNAADDDEEIEIWIDDEKIKLKKSMLKNGIGGTYVIRRKKRENFHLENEDNSSVNRLSDSPVLSNRSSYEFRKHSSTFDNLKLLMNEGIVGKQQATTEAVVEPKQESHFHTNNGVSKISNKITVQKDGTSSQQVMSKNTASVPRLSCEDLAYVRREPLSITLEEDEDVESVKKQQMSSPLRRIERNISILLDRDEIEVGRLMGAKSKGKSSKESLVNDFDNKLNLSPCTKSCNLSSNHVVSPSVQKSSSHHDMDQCHVNGKKKFFSKRCGSLQKSESAKEVLSSYFVGAKNDDCFSCNGLYGRHDFPPLPPSPVEEDDEYTEVYPSSNQLLKNKADTLPTDIGYNGINNEKMPISHYQSQKGNQKSNSLNTKLDGVNYFRIRRNQPKNLSNRSMSSDRYPPYQGDSTGLTQSKLILNHKRASQNSQNDSSSNLMQTSCSLPETPIFNRMAYCDIPRTPLRKTATDSSTSTLLNSKMAPRQSNTIATLSSINNYGTGPLNYRRGNSISGLESAAFSGELLRMTGGPARGWYPKHRNSTTRPTSVEQLDRLSSIRQSRTPFWSAASSPTNNEDKPLTLPPNLTPKCFQRSPKEALRRVTSLLIKRGSSTHGKETKKEKSANTLKKSKLLINCKKTFLYRGQ